MGHPCRIDGNGQVFDRPMSGPAPPWDRRRARCDPMGNSPYSSVNLKAAQCGDHIGPAEEDTVPDFDVRQVPSLHPRLNAPRRLLEPQGEFTLCQKSILSGQNRFSWRRSWRGIFRHRADIFALCRSPSVYLQHNRSPSKCSSANFYPTYGRPGLHPQARYRVDRVTACPPAMYALSMRAPRIIAAALARQR